MDDDHTDELVIASKIGIAYSDYLQMDNYEFAAYIRGYDLRMIDLQKWQRYWTAVLLQPHSKKKGVDPKQLYKFPDENKIPTAPKVDDWKKKHMEEVFRKWDEQEKNNVTE